MKNKSDHKLAVALLMTIFCTPALASVVYSFPGWDFLVQKTPDIVIARCSKTPDPFKDHGAGPTGDLFDSNIEIVSILTGATNWGTMPLKTPNLGAGRLTSQYIPRQGEYYLLFSIFDYGYYQTEADYCVVPLGLYFSTSSIAGKPLDKQVQILLQRRLDELNRQMNEEQEEKDRFEQALQK
jgi:hypothetical protein